MDSFELTLNGERVQVRGVDPQTTLLNFLRQSGRTGTKEGCAEGDCGACTVALVDKDAHGRTTYRAINSCIALLPMFAGREVITAEGLAREGALHPVQSAMVENYGSQCGYCTPGFVMSMFEGYNRTDLGASGSSEENAKIGDQLNGNLCRCTGYRPIRDAMLDALGKKSTRPADLFQLRLKKEDASLSALRYEADGSVFLRPSSKAELLTLRAENPEYELIAGATEIGVYMNKKMQAFPRLLSVESVPELTAIALIGNELHVGGGASLTLLEEALSDRAPAITKMLWAFASRPIRSRATLAGNLITASPIGDMAPVLLAVDARIVLASIRGEREIPLSELFVGLSQNGTRERRSPASRNHPALADSGRGEVRSSRRGGSARSSCISRNRTPNSRVVQGLEATRARYRDRLGGVFGRHGFPRAGHARAFGIWRRRGHALARRENRGISPREALEPRDGAGGCARVGDGVLTDQRCTRGRAVPSRAVAFAAPEVLPR